MQSGGNRLLRESSRRLLLASHSFLDSSPNGAKSGGGGGGGRGGGVVGSLLEVSGSPPGKSTIGRSERPRTPPHLHSVLVHNQCLTVYTPHLHSVLVHNQCVPVHYSFPPPPKQLYKAARRRLNSSTLFQRRLSPTNVLNRIHHVCTGYSMNKQSQIHEQIG